MKVGIRKVGWHWTAKHGWKRIPRNLRRVKKVPMPPKHRTRKKMMIMATAEPRAEKTKRGKAPEMAAEQGRADSAPTLAPKAEKPATRQPRKAWAGKYAGLAPPEPQDAAKPAYAKAPAGKP